MNAIRQFALRNTETFAAIEGFFSSRGVTYTGIQCPLIQVPSGQALASVCRGRGDALLAVWAGGNWVPDILIWGRAHIFLDL